jgi:Domain of unknown function (DUF4403)
MSVGRGHQRVAVAIVCVLVAGAVFGAVSLWRASQIKILPAAPSGRVSPPSIPPTTSYLSAGVSISDAAIAAELEKVVPKSFHFDVRGDARVYGTPSRGAVSVHINPGGSQVVVSMPVGGRIQVEKRIAIVNASVGIDVSGGIDASFSPVVQPNWTVNPQLNLNAHLNRAVAKTTFGDIDITGHVQGAVGGAMNGARGAIDGQLARALNIRKDVEHLWDQISAVHKLSDSPRIWLRITPKQVFLQPFHYQPSAIDAALAVVLETHVFIQDAPPERVKVPLPNLETKDPLPNEFAIALPVEVPYDVLNRELNKQLAHKPIELSDVGASVTISNATITPYGDGILLSVDFTASKGTWASVSGRLYIAGKTKFDSANVELRVEQLDYTTETKNLLLKSADWLEHSTLLKKMHDAAVLKLGDEVAKAQEQANKQLDSLKKQLPKEIHAEVSVVPSIEQIEFAADKAFAIVRAKGKISVQINP